MKRVCIIGGFPRAGSRQFTDILNAHPNCEIKGEVFRKSFAKVGELVTQADADHANSWSKRSYSQNRTFLFFNAVAGISKGSGQPFNFDHDVIGFKCPRIEFDINVLDMILKDGQYPATFFYCIRRLSENFLSAKSTFNVTPENFATVTKKSIRTFLKMHSRPDVDTKILSLDSFITSEDKAGWITTEIFSGLPEIPFSPEMAETILASVKNTNATEKVGKVRIRELSIEERAFFKADVNLQELSEKLQRVSGASVWDM